MTDTEHERATEAGPADRVTAVETFFDVVFVFTLTQLTRTLGESLTLATGARILLVFGALWYMYGGYAWLTNHVPPRRAGQKLALFVAMAGFFVAALAIPSAFAGGGVLFAAGYLAVIVVHLLLFTQADVHEGLLRLAPFNLGGALLLLAAGFTGGRMTYALWIAGYLVMTVVPYLVPRLSWVGAAQTFHLSAGHFVERHGLLVMIALGESVIAIGMGVDLAHVTVGAIAMVVLALALPGALWWAYFADEHAAEAALAAADEPRRSLLALAAYYFAHIPILLGIVAAAAGIHAAVAHPSLPAGWRAASALAGGVALFLLGMAAFRRALRIDSPWSRVAAALASVASVPLGALGSAWAHLAVVLSVVVLLLIATRPRRAVPRAGA